MSEVVEKALEEEQNPARVGSKPLTILYRFYTFVLLVGGLLWALDVPSRLGFALIEPEWLGPYLGVATAAALLRWPYGGGEARAVDALLGFAAIGCWLWLAINYAAWMFDVDGYTLGKFIPGALGIGLMVEGVRKSCGTAIAVLLVIMFGYALLGYLLPRPMQADDISPELLVMYLYSDTSAIPGQVLGIIASVVLAFVVFGKLMEVSGATHFFTDTAMALMGRRRGGPAKIAVVASGMMGSITGSPVSNIMSTGVVTIPMMKRMGFSAEESAAVEATASTGGVLAPPVMGAAAFLMAEFLSVDYGAVALAAALPAFFYFLCLYLQVDAVAARMGLSGLPREELPRLGTALRAGWIFVLPMALLLYLLFFEGLGAQYAAIASSLSLLALSLLRGRLRTRAEWSQFVFGSGSILIPLVLVAGAAGVVVGVMNLTGLGQSLSVVLVQIGTDWGLLAMLLLTALLCIVLGLGMPTTAIYVLLAAIIAPALVKMGVTPMGAHLFILYFGVLSFLTPPVAVSSYVAAGIAGADMWRTGWLGMRMSIMASLLPFLWAYDPALLMQGSWLSIATVCCTILSAVLLIARGVAVVRGGPLAFWTQVIALGLVVLAVGSSTLWLKHQPLLALAVAAAGFGLYAVMPAMARRAGGEARQRA
ncbi:MAG TPA: TRAP transporter fused permease subunit [Steroidobacteraceae bacterium]|nr:TRAP transporter fused permease subunit [Steroidobacteraceae bacterium]